MASRYKYSKLDNKKRQIRLLHLYPPDLPAMEDSHAIVAPDDICCSFSLASLDDEPSYEALSYVWGTAEAISLVSFQDDYLPVTKHLQTILKHLRQDTERVLWIDALCIDQSNVDERSQQVSQMHDIFSQASRVLVYLGEAWDGIDSALELIAFAGDRLDWHWDSVSNNINKSDASDASSASEYESIARLLTSQWWTRVWTVQEYVLARNVTFMRGDYTLDATGFDRFLEYGHRHGGLCCNLVNRIDSMSSEAYRFRELYMGAYTLKQMLSHTESELGLLWRLMMFRSRTCSDPRDKIYGILGIVPMTMRSAIIIDYKRPPRHVYRDVTLECFKKEGLLPLSCVYGDSNPDLALLSWVPDFSSLINELNITFRMSRLGPILHLFRASQKSTAHFIYTEQDKVSVHAIAVDTINIISRPGNTRKGLVDACWEALAACEASSRRYPSIKDAFWRTICGSAIESTSDKVAYRPILDEDFEAFEKWLTWIGIEEYEKTGGFMEDDVRRFNFMFGVVVAGRNFAITEKGCIGWVPEKAGQGDVVMLFSGGNVPYILRPVDQSTCTSSSADSGDCNHLYEFCGDAYIHGIMHGEAYDETKLQDISLV